MGTHDYSPSARERETEAGKFVARLGYIARTYLKKRKRRKERPGMEGGRVGSLEREKEHLSQSRRVNQRLRHNLHSGLQTVT